MDKSPCVGSEVKGSGFKGYNGLTSPKHIQSNRARAGLNRTTCVSVKAMTERADFQDHPDVFFGRRGFII